VFTPHHASDPITSQACRASGGSRNVATNAPVVLLPAPDVIVGEAPAPPNRAHRGRNRGVIATPSCPGWGSAGGRRPTRTDPGLSVRDWASTLGLEAMSAWSPRDWPACGAAHRNPPCDLRTTEARRLPGEWLAKACSRLVRTVTASWSGCRFVNGRRCTTRRRCEPPRKRQASTLPRSSRNQ
jgi:hypothetical protein